jgi:UDP-N-acetylglucosamine 2-epimerase (non-hydrolysing)
MSLTMQKILIIFGTRPEAVKLAPVIKGFKENQGYNVEVCITGQHRELLAHVLDFFEIAPNYNLDVMIDDQSLFHLTYTLIAKLEKIYETSNPDWVIVQGDTTTTFVASLTAFYNKIKIAHIEAGLRSFNKYSPFPEEINRVLVSRLADIHFAPTVRSKENLLNEGINENKIYVVGNTVVDALLWCLQKVKGLKKEDFGVIFDDIDFLKRIILVTGHRRESFGRSFENICYALKEIGQRYKDVEIVYPVHLNPKVREPVFRILGEQKQIHLLAPLNYPAFIWLMNKSFLILTDSGGIQEEAPSLGKPVLVMREVTERKEGIEFGAAMLTSTDKDKILKMVSKILESKVHYSKMNTYDLNPYGDGKAGEKIVQIISSTIQKNS